MKEEQRSEKNSENIISSAYLRDGHTIHTGEALLLACLLHAKGAGRNTNDMQDVLRIMKDKNVPHTLP